MTLLTDEAHADMIALRRDFHRHPELSFHETRTAEIVAEHLQRYGLEDVRTGVGGTGVTAVLSGGEGKTVLLRADMDALPIVEEDRGQPYRSENEGVHHACGHDGHTAILLTVARLLASRRRDLPGRIVFAFQPAEEKAGGAEPMIADGALDLQPDACFGLHLWTEVPAGRVDVRPGSVFANVDDFAVTLRGPGGHGAQPQLTRDPIVAAAHLVLAYQTLVSRETPPLEPSVLTLASIHGGTATNIISTQVELLGTLRTFSHAVRDKLLRRAQEMAEEIPAALAGVEGRLKLLESHCPACVNDEAMANFVRSTAQETVGQDNVTSTQRTAGGDDMAYFLERVPGCYFFVGAGPANGDRVVRHHSPAFDIEEGALAVGAETLGGAALRYLASGGRTG